MKDTIFIGIDPGLTGAIGVIQPHNTYVIDMPVLTIEGKRVRSRKTGKVKSKKKHVYNIKELNKIIIDIKTTAITLNMDVEAWIEKSQAMPDQGGVSNFNYGFGYGVINAVVVCNNIRKELIHPRTWKNKIMYGQGKEKDAAVYKAQQLFPELEFCGPRGGLLHGRAEAMLIAEYGKRYSYNNF